MVVSEGSCLFRVLVVRHDGDGGDVEVSTSSQARPRGVSPTEVADWCQVMPWNAVRARQNMRIESAFVNWPFFARSTPTSS